MKTLVKIIGYLFVVLATLVLVLVLTATFAQNKIVDIALKEMSSTLQTPIEVDHVSFTLLKKFPYATLEFKGIKVGAKVKDATTNPAFQKDIATIQHAYISLKTKPLLQGNFEITKVELRDANVFYYTDSLGKTNVDHLLAEKEESPANTPESPMPKVDLEAFTLEKVHLSYRNDSAGLAAEIRVEDLTLQGEIDENKLQVEVEGMVQLSNCHMDSTELYQLHPLTMQFAMQVHQDTIRWTKLHLHSEEIELMTQGNLVLDSLFTSNIHIEKGEIHLEHLLKFVPPPMAKDYGVQAMGGTFSLTGNVAGALLDTVLPAINMEYKLADGRLKTTSYPPVEKVNFSGTFTNGFLRNFSTTRVAFQTFMAQSNKSRLQGSFSIQNLNRPIFALQSDAQIALNEWQPWIPDSLAQNVQGKIDASFSTRGTLPDSVNEAFVHEFLQQSRLTVNLQNVGLTMDTLEVRDFSGSLHYQPGMLKATNVSVSLPQEHLYVKNALVDIALTGPLTQPDQLELMLRKLHMELPQGTFDVQGEVKNMYHPEFRLQGSTQLQLEAFQPFVPDTLLQTLTGKVELSLETFGKLHPDSLETQVNQILFKQTRLNLQAKDISIVMPDTLLQVKNLNGTIRMVPDSLFISKASGTGIGVPFALDSVSIHNAYQTLVLNHNDLLTLNGNLALGDIDHHIFDALLALPVTEETASTNDTTSSGDLMNFRYALKGKLAINSFTFDHQFIHKMANYLELDEETERMLHSYVRDRITAQNMAAKYNITDSISNIEDFVLNAFGGSMNHAIRYRLWENGEQSINVRSFVSQMDIRQLLYDCNNFLQDSMITYQNISGLFSADSLYSRVKFSKEGEMMPEETRVMGKLRLENGGVYEYEPAMYMSKFTGIKQLDNIQFKTLNSEIFMFKEKLYVPKTIIVSTALDIAAFGMQSLADDYEYHLQVNVGSILTGKDKKRTKKQFNADEEASVDDLKKRTTNLIYANNNGKRRRGYAPEGTRDLMEQKIRTQLTMLNLVFYPTLVPFESGVK